MISADPVRIVLGKLGLDGHDRGVKIVVRALSEAGYDVFYTGLHQTPEQIVDVALRRDVDAVGLSSLSGAHMTLFPRVVELLREKGGSDVVVFGGGIIPVGDIVDLQLQGIEQIFTPGTDTGHIVDWLKRRVPFRNANRANLGSV